MTLHSEIREQPLCLYRLLCKQRRAAETIADAIRRRDIRFVYIAARGTSENAGRYATYVWGAINGFPVTLAAPSLFTYYNHPPELRNALVVGISQSGMSPDIVSVMEEARHQSCMTVAITNAVESPLAQEADFVLDIQAGEEDAVAATKSYTAELMAIAMLSAAMKSDGYRWEQLSYIPELVQLALAQDSLCAEKAEQYGRISGCAVLGRGFNYATAYEWALKLKELTYVLAEPYSSADFIHGPIAMVDDGFPILAIVPTGAVYRSTIDLLRKLRHESEAELFVISDSDEARKLAQSSLRIPRDIPEWLSPLVSIVPAQLFSYYLARSKGCDTESPRGIQKVTETR